MFLCEERKPLNQLLRWERSVPDGGRCLLVNLSNAELRIPCEMWVSLDQSKTDTRQQIKGELNLNQKHTQYSINHSLFCWNPQGRHEVLWATCRCACASGVSGQRHLRIVMATSVRPYHFRLVHPQFGSGVHGTLAFSLSTRCVWTTLFSSSQLFLVGLFSIYCMDTHFVCTNRMFVTHTLMLRNPKTFYCGTIMHLAMATSFY